LLFLLGADFELAQYSLSLVVQMVFCLETVVLVRETSLLLMQHLWAQLLLLDI
jgi:hypothetical protein